MKRLIEFSLDDGGSVVVELDEPELERGVVKAVRPGEVAERAKETFEAALERIRPAAATIIAKLRDLVDPPDEIEVEFGMKLTAEAGAVLASVGAEANYQVTLTWKRTEQQKE